MLKDGEKGAISQADKKSYAIAPHVSCGLLTPQVLRKLADVAEKYRLDPIKITGACRIALFGAREEDLDAIWADLGMEPGSLAGLCIRSVRCCPGAAWCRLGKRETFSIAKKLDELYHGRKLAGKCKLAVSGCPISCAEGWVRDIGLYGKSKGWHLTVGGNVGSSPRLAVELLDGLDDETALRAIEAVVEYFEANAKRGERLGKLIDRLGIDGLRAHVAAALGPSAGA